MSNTEQSERSEAQRTQPDAEAEVDSNSQPTDDAEPTSTVAQERDAKPAHRGTRASEPTVKARVARQQAAATQRENDSRQSNQTSSLDSVIESVMELLLLQS